MLATWWVWAVVAAALGAIEVLAPGWIFLGFALGAAALSLTLFFGGPLAALATASVPLTLLLFAGLSLAAWAALRAIFGARKDEVRIVRRDINDN